MPLLYLLPIRSPLVDYEGKMALITVLYSEYEFTVKVRGRRPRSG
jgi:hypothetical protein